MRRALFLILCLLIPAIINAQAPGPGGGDGYFYQISFVKNRISTSAKLTLDSLVKGLDNTDKSLMIHICNPKYVSQKSYKWIKRREDKLLRYLLKSGFSKNKIYQTAATCCNPRTINLEVGTKEIILGH